MFAHTRDLSVNSAEETAKIARSLAPLLTRGDTILLSGVIGAGKTHFARNIISALLPQPEDIPSPTFTLVQTYELSDLEIWHVDLYRLTSVFEIEELGLFDAFANQICIVEWPDRLENMAPDNALSIRFDLSQDENDRLLTFQWTDPAWIDKLKSALDE